jgi:ATP-dependent DNA helicase PIF1
MEFTDPPTTVPNAADSVPVTSDKKINISPPTSCSLNINDLSPEQKVAYQKYCQGSNLFITGPGGTGKTRLIKNFVEFSNSVNQSAAVCAMTGCASILLNCNARTLHSWSGIKLAKGPKDKIITAVLNNRNVVKTWKRTKVLILDEVSMLSKKIFEIIEEIARIIYRSSSPFGGLQVVFTGDFYQLPPVGTDGEPDTDKFCFESPIWSKVFKLENHIELKTIFRQTDPLYIDILMQIRRGELDEDKKKILQTYVNRTYDPANHNGCIPTKLFPLRSKTDYVNTMMFSKIQENEFVFEVVRKTDCRTILESNKALNLDVMAKCANMTSAEITYEFDQLLNNTACSQMLRLKKGAAVMCTVNLDMEQSICNGSQGIVLNIIENGPNTLIVVKFSNGITKTISPHFWQSEEYPTLAVGQYPLCLAWALTIHKIQGATLEMAEIDIGQSIFEYGQTYVALSRIQSLNGLYLSAFYAQKIRSHPRVVAFYNQLAAVKPVEPVSIATTTTTTTTKTIRL